MKEVRKRIFLRCCLRTVDRKIQIFIIISGRTTVLWNWMDSGVDFQVSFVFLISIVYRNRLKIQDPFKKIVFEMYQYLFVCVYTVFIVQFTSNNLQL